MITELSADKTPEGMARKENVEELMSGIQLFCKDRIEEGSNEIYLSDYLGSVSLMTDQDKEDDAEVSKVTMMTIHASKGLEFKAVMIVGLEETLFPSDMSTSDHELEEERRLMYVAMTRAKKSLELLYLTGTKERPRLPSRFLNPILKNYSSSTSSSNSQLSRYSSKASS